LSQNVANKRRRRRWLKTFDFGATLVALQADPDVRAAGAGLIAEIVAKLPRGIKADDLSLGESRLDALLDEARSFVLTRMASEG
jgi:hypothetical protein